MPFQGKGHSVYERFVAEFTLVPEQDQPSLHTPFPQVADVNKVVMTYDEGGIRRAPRLVTIRGDGQVDVAGYDGYGHKLPPHITIPKETVLGLIDGFRRADFFSLQEGYGGGPSEGTHRVTSITIDGQTKTIDEYEGQFGGLPDSVMEIEDAIERAGGFGPKRLLEILHVPNGRMDNDLLKIASLP